MRFFVFLIIYVNLLKNYKLRIDFPYLIFLLIYSLFFIFLRQSMFELIILIIFCFFSKRGRKRKVKVRKRKRNIGLIID